MLADLNLDPEYPLEPLSPGHGRTTFGGRLVLRLIRCFGVAGFAPLRRRHLHTLVTVGRKDPMKASQVDAGFVRIPAALPSSLGSPVYGVKFLKLCFHRLGHQLPGTGNQRLGKRVSTGKLNNVTLSRSGVSPLVALMSHNNTSTRYAAFLQPLIHQIRL